MINKKILFSTFQSLVVASLMTGCAAKGTTTDTSKKSSCGCSDKKCSSGTCGGAVAPAGSCSGDKKCSAEHKCSADKCCSGKK